MKAFIKTEAAKEMCRIVLTTDIKKKLRSSRNEWYVRKGDLWVPEVRDKMMEELVYKICADFFEPL